MTETFSRSVAPWLAMVATALLGWACGPSSAKAEEWLVVPVVLEEGAEGPRDLADHARTELEQRGRSVASGLASARAFEARVSTPPAVLTDAEVDAWAEHSRAALLQLARNDYDAALAELEDAHAVSRAAPETLNRDATNAATLSDTCLYAVRALLGVGKRATAQVRAVECARLSPGVAPDPRMHPPTTRTFYEDVIGAGRSKAGTLVVESDASCVVRVNGVAFGTAPARVGGLPEGEYRVQVECDSAPGRVHRVNVDGGTTTLEVDASLDRAVWTDEALELRYPVLPGRAHLEREARSLARLLNVHQVLLVVPAGNAHALLAVGTEGESRSVRVETTAADAVRTLLGEAPEATPQGRPPRGKFLAGVSLASIGAASLLTSYALYAVNGTQAADDMVALPNNENQARWLNLRTGMYYTGAAGAGALVSAMPLVLPYREKTPWWAWVSGGVGVGLAATSIALAVTAPSTPTLSRVSDPQGYVDRAKRTDPAFLTGVTAAPLITMPLVYLLRPDEPRRRTQLAPQVQASRRSAFFGVRGRY